MSDALNTLRSVVAGRPGSECELLHTCRVEVSGCEVIGYQCIGELFRREPSPIDAQLHVVQSLSSLAVLDANTEGKPVAFFADVFDDRIGRLWRIGPEVSESISADPVISVPFDPLMSQVASRVAFTETDHPELDETVLPHIRQVVGNLCDKSNSSDDNSIVRRVAFVLRVVSQDDKCAVLVKLHELVSAPVRRSDFRLAAVFFRYAGGKVVHSIAITDEHGEKTEWAPRVLKKGDPNQDSPQ